MTWRCTRAREGSDPHTHKFLTTCIKELLTRERKRGTPEQLRANLKKQPFRIDDSRQEFPHMIVGHHPKTLRTLAARYPKHVIRTTWVFTKKWVEIEKAVDIRTLDSRVAKLPDPAVLSVTIFKRREDNPEPEPDSDQKTEAESNDEKRSAHLDLQADSLEHKFTRRPNNPFCKVCQKAKMLAPHSRKRLGSSTIFSKKFGDHVTVDHIVTKDLRDFDIDSEKVAMVVKGVFTNFEYVYPSGTKEGGEAYNSRLLISCSR